MKLSTESILEETSWSYSGVSDLIQGDPNAGKEVLQQVVAEYLDTLPKLEAAKKEVERLDDQRKGLLSMLVYVKKHLKLSNEFNFLFAGESVASVVITDENVMLEVKELL